MKTSQMMSLLTARTLGMANLALPASAALMVVPQRMMALGLRQELWRPAATRRCICSSRMSNIEAIVSKVAQVNRAMLI